MSSETDGLGALFAGYKASTVVDLTVTLAEHLPAAWPTHMPYQRKLYNWYVNDPNHPQPALGHRGPYHTAFLTLDEHCGTHIDAPAHFHPTAGFRFA